MMKKWRVLGVFLLVFLLTGCQEDQNKPIKKDRGKSSDIISTGTTERVELNGAGLSIQLECGLGGYVKYDRYMKVSAKITNYGNDFSGWFQMILPTDNENSMYQKEFFVPSGETRRRVMLFPASMNQNRILCSVNRSNGETVCSQDIYLNMDYGTDTVYIGVYGEKNKKMGYMGQKNTRVFKLKKRDFLADHKALDVLDVIVISDGTLKEFDKKQIRAIVLWVRRGGSLILADSGKHREWKRFSKKMLSWEAGDTKQIMTSFGLDSIDTSIIIQHLVQNLEEQKAEQVQDFLAENLSVKLYNTWRQEIEAIRENTACLEETGEIFSYLREDYEEEDIKEKLSLSVTDEERFDVYKNLTIPVVSRKLTELSMYKAEILMTTEEGETILQKGSFGMGNVFLSGCSLALGKKNWDVLGNEILIRILDNLSEKKKKQLLTERQQDFGNSNQIYEQGLLVTETDRLPNLKLYAVILLGYVLLVSPVLFLVYRRKNRFNYLWGVIPAVAVLFSVLIYLIGTSTRIRGPYVNYLTHLQLGEEGEAVQHTWFRLISGKNNPYEAVFKGNYDIEPLAMDHSYQVVTDEDKEAVSWDYEYGIEYGNEATKITFAELSVFEGKNFKDEEVVKVQGDIQTELVYDDMSLQGTVKNQFDYDLEDCFLFHRGTVYYLGDIKSKKGVCLEDLDRDDIYQQKEYNYDYDELANLLFGTDYLASGNETDCEMQRRAVLAQGYLNEIAASETVFVGFATSDQAERNSYIKQFSYDKYGAMCISKQVGIKYTADGMELLPALSQYAVSYDSSVTDGKKILDTRRSRIQVSYRLPVGYQWKGLIYNQADNPEFSYYNKGYISSAIFNGSVNMVDWRTGQENRIIESGREVNLELQPEDVSQDNVLTLYYYLSTSGGYDLQLPNIMVSVSTETSGDQKKNVREAENDKN